MGRQRWYARIALTGMALSLLATSSPISETTFTSTFSAPDFELTAASPTASFSVRAIVKGLGAEGIDTSQGARAEIEGIVSPSAEVMSEHPTVAVSVDDSDVQPFEGVISTVQYLQFSGDCRAPTAAAPCIATMTVKFKRTDDGEWGGKLGIQWHVTFTKERLSEGGDGGSFELPWDVEFERL